MSSDIESLLDDLPDDPFLGSFELVGRIEKVILAGRPNEVQYSRACAVLQAFWEVNGWKIPDPISVRDSGTLTESTDDVVERIRGRFRRQFESYRNQALSNYVLATKLLASDRINSSLAGSIGYAVLSAEEKAEIHDHLARIREIIERSDLNDRKKNSLYAYISSLDREVDRNGTKTDRFFAFTSELGFYLGEFATRAKPLFEEAKQILRVVTKARARTEQLELPPGGEVLSLPDPASGDPR
jgi:hypothetical protein